MDNSISLIDNHHSTSYIIHTSSIRDAHSLYLSLRSVLLPTASPPLPEHFEVAIPEWSLVIQIPLRNPKITMDEIRTMCIESVDKMYENDPEELPIWNRWKSTGELRMSWRRGERLEWVFDDNTAVMCPRLLEKTHALELRKARSPKVCLEGKFISKVSSFLVIVFLGRGWY
ncbi:hypothetical protein BKA69DRAFT_1081643 [Paraphysoderma sedebokerense]|nr:hypothetical protein BKA69DRAFT_1081643 [Paraphysoderma sedebokerense]